MSYACLMNMVIIAVSKLLVSGPNTWVIFYQKCVDSLFPYEYVLCPCVSSNFVFCSGHFDLCCETLQPIKMLWRILILSRQSTQLGVDCKFYLFFCVWWFQQFKFQSFCSLLWVEPCMCSLDLSRALMPCYMQLGVHFSSSLFSEISRHTLFGSQKLFDIFAIYCTFQ